MAKNVRWSDFDYEPLAAHYEVGICGSADGCVGGYSASRHIRGYTDPEGTVHWRGWLTDKPRKRGLHRLLMLIADDITGISSSQRWIDLWRKERWVSEEGERLYRVRFPVSYSRASRMEARRWVSDHKIAARTINHAAYQWMMYGTKEE